MAPEEGEVMDEPMLIHIPIRRDVTVSVQMPWNLSYKEAEKVVGVIKALQKALLGVDDGKVRMESCSEL